MKMIVFILCIITLNVFAQTAAINKNEIGSVLDKMVADGVITAEQAKEAKADMMKMGDQDWAELTNKAHEVVNRDPKLKQFMQTGEVPKFEGAESFKGIQNALDEQGYK